MQYALFTLERDESIRLLCIVPLCVIIVTPGIFYLFNFLTCSDEQECQCFADSLFQRKNIHNLVRKIFRVFDKGDRDDQTLFSDYVVPHRFIYKLLFVTVFISGLVGSVFWLKFLIKDTFNCDSGDPSIDCFSEDNGTYGNSVDCSDNNATDIICFKFVLEIGEAVGTAGGDWCDFLGTIGTIGRKRRWKEKTYVCPYISNQYSCSCTVCVYWYHSCCSLH